MFRPLLFCALALAAGLFPASARAQTARPTVGDLGVSSAMAWPESAGDVGPPLGERGRRPLAAVALASGAGLAFGTLAGGAVGAAVDRGEYAIGGAVLGGWAGGAAGAGTGAWLANGKRGSLPLAIAASALAQAAYVYVVTNYVREASGFETNVIVAGYPLVAITTSTAVIRLTSRR